MTENYTNHYINLLYSTAFNMVKNKLRDLFFFYLLDSMVQRKTIDTNHNAWERSFTLVIKTIYYELLLKLQFHNSCALVAFKTKTQHRNSPSSRSTSDLPRLRSRHHNTALQPRQRKLIPFTKAPRSHCLDRILNLPPVQVPRRELIDISLLQTRE